MATVFREEVETSAWLGAVESWIDEQLARSGRRRTGPGDQRRIRPWSTQVVVPTDDGPVWFKANNPHLAHEAAVHATLARLLPDQVDTPLGVDPERGWLLTADRGATLQQREGLTSRDLAEVVDLVGGIQRRLVDHEQELLAAGLPDCRPRTVADRWEWVVTQVARLPADHPSHLGRTEAAELRARRDDVAAAAERLDGSLPPTLQHGDAHPGNVFATDDGLRLFDFGDAQWAHPLETLVVPWAVGNHAGVDWPPALSAYAERWADLVDRDGLVRLWSDALVTHSVNRAVLWLHSVEGARPDELAEWGGMAAARLREAFDPADPVG